MIREMFNDEPVLSSVFLVLILTLIFILIDALAANPVPFQGALIDKHYKAKSTSIGTGSGVTSNGNIGTVTTVEVDSEKFLLIIMNEEGEIITVESTPEVYYEKEKGDRVNGNYYRGFFTNSIWSTKATH